MIKKRKKASRFRASHTHGAGFKRKLRCPSRGGVEKWRDRGKRGVQNNSSVSNNSDLLLR
jgi:hypothetical protein